MASLTSQVQGLAGTVASGTSIANAFLVAVQKLNFDVTGSDDKAYLFAFRENDTIDLSSDITDYFIEDNTAIQDQIALKPEVVTLKGFVGELSDQTEGILKRIDLVASQLTVLAPYVPALTAAALKTYNAASQVYNTFQSAKTTITELASIGKDSTHQTRQQKAYTFFKDRWKARMLFTVQTPWEIFENMAIQTLRVTQDNETDTISDFMITFKQMNFAMTGISAQTVNQGRLIAQASDVVNQGLQNPPDIGPLGDVIGSSSSIQTTVFT